MASTTPASQAEGIQSTNVNTPSTAVRDAENTGHVEMDTLASSGVSSERPQVPSTTKADGQAEAGSEHLESSAPAAKTEDEADDSIEAPHDSTGASPTTPGKKTIQITLLLTNGNRHPFKIDNKYLQKREVHANYGDPYEISVYNLKELIWKDWRDEWETRPSTPGYIRLIHFGRLLEDKSPLKDCRFNPESPNVLHMTVKPQEIIEEEEVSKKEGSRRGNNSNRGGVNCCVIL